MPQKKSKKSKKAIKAKKYKKKLASSAPPKPKFKPNQKNDYSLYLIPEFRKPKYLYYSDTPHGPERKIPLEEANALFKITFREGWSSEEPVSLYFSQSPDDLRYFDLKNIQTYCDQFVISKISDQVGYGVFARKPFKHGQLIAPYSGILADCSQETKNGQYVFEFNNTAVDAEHTGGIAHFINHLPVHAGDYMHDLARKGYDARFCRDYGPPTSLIPHRPSKIDALNDVRRHILASSQTGVMSTVFNLIEDNRYVSEKKIQYANAAMFYYRFSEEAKSGMPALYAIRDIAIGEQIGWTYSTEYFAGRAGTCRLFDKQGGVIPQDQVKISCFFRHPPKGQIFDMGMQLYSNGLFQQLVTSLEPIKLYGDDALQSVFQVREKMISIGFLDRKWAGEPFATGPDMIPKNCKMTSHLFQNQKKIIRLVVSSPEMCSEILKATKCLSTFQNEIFFSFDSWPVLAPILSNLCQQESSLPSIQQLPASTSTIQTTEHCSSTTPTFYDENALEFEMERIDSIMIAAING